jgi:hypothetical protein
VSNYSQTNLLYINSYFLKEERVWRINRINLQNNFIFIRKWNKKFKKNNLNKIKIYIFSYYDN